MNDFTPEDARSLSGILHRVTSTYDKVFDVPFPYSMGFHQSPCDGEQHPEWHFHAHFYPPLLRSATIRKFMVGFEMLGMPQTRHHRGKRGGTVAGTRENIAEGASCSGVTSSSRKAVRNENHTTNHENRHCSSQPHPSWPFKLRDRPHRSRPHGRSLRKIWSSCSRAHRNRKPLMIQVGSHVLYTQAHIPGSEYIGPASSEAGLQQLRKRVAMLRRTQFIVLYCGCCPWEPLPQCGTR